MLQPLSIPLQNGVRLVLDRYDSLGSPLKRLILLCAFRFPCLKKMGRYFRTNPIKYYKIPLGDKNYILRRQQFFTLPRGTLLYEGPWPTGSVTPSVFNRYSIASSVTPKCRIIASSDVPSSNRFLISISGIKSDSPK